MCLSFIYSNIGLGLTTIGDRRHIFLSKGEALKFTLGTVHLIFKGGRGAWVFGSGPKYFFRTKSEQNDFFRRPFGPDYFFFLSESYIYNT